MNSTIDTPLYDSERHRQLKEGLSWSDTAAKDAIEEIYDRALESFDFKNYWPTDANEDSDIDCNKSMYYGAAGGLRVVRH